MSHNTSNYTLGKTATEIYGQRILLYIPTFNIMLINKNKKKRKKMFENIAKTNFIISIKYS